MKPSKVGLRYIAIGVKLAVADLALYGEGDHPPYLSEDQCFISRDEGSTVPNKILPESTIYVCMHTYIVDWGRISVLQHKNLFPCTVV